MNRNMHSNTLKHLKKRILKKPVILETITIGEIPLTEIINDIVQGLINSLPDYTDEYSHGENLPNINAVLKYLLSCVYDNTDNIPLIEDAFLRFHADSVFFEWFRRKALFNLGESLTVRCLKFIQVFPALGDSEHLFREFLMSINLADLFLNPPKHAVENIYSVLIETVVILLKIQGAQFPVNDDEFNENFSHIENEVKRKMEELTEKRIFLDSKEIEYALMAYEDNATFKKNGAAFLFDIFLARTELRQFLFTGLNISLCYFVYLIALDEAGHFLPVVRQSAFSALKAVPESCLYKKLKELRSDFFTVYGVSTLIVPDTSVQEFAYSVAQALRLIDYKYDYKTIKDISRSVLEGMKDSRIFLHEFPLKITLNPGIDVLTKTSFSLAFRHWNDGDYINPVKRRIEILDYTLPNSRGIPSELFFDKNLTLPFIRREYLSYFNITNEAEIRLRSVNDTYIPPSFVRTLNTARVKDLILTYMMFLEMYIQGDDVFDSGKGSSINREDIAMLLEHNFDLCKLTAESLLHAKIMLWYIEPIHSIFRFGEADETALERINEYTESVYGKPLGAQEAMEKARSIMAAESENIITINKSIEGETDKWPLLEEDNPQWTRLFGILVKHCTSRNTLTLWEFRGVIYNMMEKPPSLPFYPAFKAAGIFIQKSILKFVIAFEKQYKWFKKVRQFIYKCIFNCLDYIEDGIDVCGWKEYNGKCLRQNRQCCSIPYPCKNLNSNKCRLSALTCKFWLCNAAVARASTSGSGCLLLILRPVFSYLCQALNIPLKVRCSFLDSFDDKAEELFTDVEAEDWFDRALRGRRNEK